MKKVLIFISIMLFLVPGLVQAIPWEAGNSIEVLSWNPSVASGRGTYGGLAEIKNTTNQETIYTFCIELNEYTATNGMKIYDIDDSIAYKGGIGGYEATSNGDPLSGATKWLYAKYLSGAITGEANIKALALAFWYLEDEYYDALGEGTGIPSLDDWVTWYNDPLATTAKAYILEAQKYPLYTNSQILVLDTYNGTTQQYQSFLYHVPEPASMLLLGLGLFGIGLVSRKRR